jgi:type I restriction-modification system DNA methylase subunit
MASEAKIHFDLYADLKSSIEERSTYKAYTYGSVEPEVPVNGGFADIIIYSDDKKPVFVIEAKRDKQGKNRDIDPYSPKVVQQAHRYASTVGAEYFATYNGQHCVLFQTFEAGKPLMQRRTRSYNVSDPSIFAGELLAEVDGIKSEDVNWDPHNQAFTQRLKVYHERLAEAFSHALENRIEDEDFESRFKTWLGQQGRLDKYENEPAVVKSQYSSQAAYLLMNKLVFYKLLEDTDTYDVPHVSMQDLVDPATRRDVFDNLIDVLDFEAVYQQDPIYDALPLSKDAKRETDEFLQQLDRFNLGAFDNDVIGQIYQRIIPAEERHELGQYYTPPDVVDLITRITVRSGDDVVLDPGCGSGGFLVSAYQRLRDLKEVGNHQQILDQIKGIDINRFPAHLSAINLALQDLSQETRDVGVEINDFFLVEPTGRLTFESGVGIAGTEEGMGQIELGEVDAVVGNPPYIRQEQIQDKDRCRRHLDRVGADLGKRSDIYAYFFTHATRFLKERGRLGFITSDRWLSVGYGEGLQDFLLDKYKIKSIVSFTRQQFELALISTVVVILERCSNEEARDSNTVKMLQLKEAKKVTDIIDLLEENHDPNQLLDREDHRLVTIQQGNLKGERKWGRYFYAPSIYWTLSSEANLIALGDVSEISRGLSTGANNFFYFEEQQEWEEWGIDSRFIRPLLKHHAEMQHTSLMADDLTWYVLDMNDYVTEVLEDNPEDPEEAVKEKLHEDGHINLLDYIRWGEGEEYHTRSSIKVRDVWFNLGALDQPPLMIGKEYWRDLVTPYNIADAAIDNRLYGVWPDSDINPLVLGGILNSSMYALMRQLHGRNEQGEGMNRNTLMVYEAKNLPIPDPRQMSTNDRENIRDAFQFLIDEEREATAGEEENLRERLDRAVMEAIGFGDRTKEVRHAADLLLQAREEGSGQMTDVLVQGAEEEPQDLRGATITEHKSTRQMELGF